MQAVVVLLNILECDTADAADCAREIFVDQLLAETDRLENFGALIRLQSGNTHLRRDFDDAVQYRVVVVLNRCVIVLVKQVVVNQLVNRFECKIGIDRASTVGEKRREVMHLARLSAFKNDRESGSLFCRDKMLM